MNSPHLAEADEPKCLTCTHRKYDAFRKVKSMCCKAFPGSPCDDKNTCSHHLIATTKVINARLETKQLAFRNHD